MSVEFSSFLRSLCASTADNLRSLFASSADKKSDTPQGKSQAKRKVKKAKSLVSPDFNNKRAAFEEKFRAYQNGMAQRQEQTGNEQ